MTAHAHPSALARSVPSAPRRLSLLPLLVVLLAGLAPVLAAPATVLASCMRLDLKGLERTPGLVVFVGTVEANAGAVVRVRVDQWFSGADPRDALAVTGGRMSNDPNVASSVDWEAQVGVSYIIVAERRDPDTVETAPCRQLWIDAESMAEATAVFGEPRLPPFGGPEATPPPTGGPVGPSPAELAIAGALALAGALIGLLVVLRLQRRPG